MYGCIDVHLCRPAKGDGYSGVWRFSILGPISKEI